MFTKCSVIQAIQDGGTIVCRTIYCLLTSQWPVFQSASDASDYLERSEIQVEITYRLSNSVGFSMSRYSNFIQRGDDWLNKLIDSTLDASV